MDPAEGPQVFTAAPTVAPTVPPTIFVVPDDGALVGMLAFYLSATAACLALYGYCMRRGWLRWLLEPKGTTSFADIFSGGRFGWAQLREAEFVSRCGLDAYMSLRSIRLMASAMLGFLVVACGILLPSYRLQPRSDVCKQWCSRAHVPKQGEAFAEDCACTVVDRYSLANVDSESAGLWLPVLAMAGCTAVLLFLLRREYHEVVRIRAAYWLSMPPEMFTVLIDDIPKHLDLHTAGGLRGHFESLFPGKVVRVDAARFVDEEVLSQLRRAGVARMDALDTCLRLRAMRDEYGDRVPACHSLAVNACTMSGSLSSRIVDAELRFDTLNRTFADLLRAYKRLAEDEKEGRISRPVTSCFVTFSSATVAAIATQTIIEHRFNVVAVPGPEPDDLRWDSLGFGLQRRACSLYTARLGFATLVLSWGALVSLVGAMTSVAALEARFETLRDVLRDNEWLRSLIEQAAPLVLTALVAVVNPVVCLLARMEARASEGDADQLATIWYFVFLVIQVFIFFGVSGSLLRTINTILDHPSRIVDVLASNIPKNAAFYIQFIVTKFVTSLCVDLFRVSDIAVHGVRRVVFGAALTERDRKVSRCGCGVITFPGHRNLSSLNGNMLLLFFIATTYAVIQPLIVPAALVFFTLAYFVYAKLFMCANMQRFDSGGTLWPRTYWLYVSALQTAQLTLIGLLSLKRGISEPSAVVLLFFATSFVAALIDFRYKRLVLETPLDLASAVDASIDASKPGVEVPASVWRYGELSRGEPNYFGRYLDFGAATSKVLASAAQRANYPVRNGSPAPQPLTTSFEEHALPDETGLGAGAGDDASMALGWGGRSTESTPGPFSSRASDDGGQDPTAAVPSEDSQQVAPPRPSRPTRPQTGLGLAAEPGGLACLPPQMRSRLVQRSSSSSLNSLQRATFASRPFEFYSYELPVLHEEPLLERGEPRVMLEPSDSEQTGLDAPLLVQAA